MDGRENGWSNKEECKRKRRHSLRRGAKMRKNEEKIGEEGQ